MSGEIMVIIKGKDRTEGKKTSPLKIINLIFMVPVCNGYIWVMAVLRDPNFDVLDLDEMV